MKVKKTTMGILKPKQIPPIPKRICPSCQTIGEYETDDNLNTYCKICGLVIESAYPYDAGIKHFTYCDFIFNQKIRELKEKWTKKKRIL